MRQRRDGEATRTRLLEAACEVFGERGFHEATHSEICKRAATNTAAVNYHFGSKEGLYRAVWSRTIELMQERYPADPGESGAVPLERRLHALVKTVLAKMSDRDQFGYSHRLHLLEMSHPSGLVDDLLERSRAPYRNRLQSLVRELLGPGATDELVELCEKSVIGQVRMLRFGLGAPPHRNPGPLSEAEVDALAGHIVRFSLAGIGAAREAAE